jgi:hypothetical protein
MAIVKFASPISGARGVVGGIIFTANGTGPFIRAYSKPINPKSPKQQGERGSMANMGNVWRNNLNQAQRDGWDVYAALPAQDLTNSLGETYSASGFNWFVKINRQRATVGSPFRFGAPVAAVPVTPTINAAILTAVEPPISQIAFAATYFAVDDAIVYMMLNPSVGRGVANQAQYVIHHVQTAAIGIPVMQINPLVDTFGIVNTSMSGHLKVYRQNSEGRRSVPSTFRQQLT